MATDLRELSSKHAYHVAACKAVWALTHGTTVYLMLNLDTQIHRDVNSNRWSSLYFLAAVVLINTTLYLTLCTKRPSKQPAVAVTGKLPLHNRLQGDPTVAGVRSPRRRGATSSSGSGSGGGRASAAANESEQAPLAGDFSISAHYLKGAAPDYCSLCSAKKGLRTHHCSLCQQCIHGYDHHCVWVGRCIGRYNHGTFWLFLATQTTLAVFALHQLLTGLRYSAQVAWGPQQWLNAAATFSMLTAAALLGGLLLFHSYLIATNQTSKEVLSREAVSYLQPYPLEVAPFHAGCCTNLWNFLWQPASCDRLRVVVHSGRLLPLDAAHSSSGVGSSGGSVWDNEYYSCC